MPAPMSALTGEFTTIRQVMDAAVAAFGDREAYVDGDQRITFAQWMRMADALAVEYKQDGVRVNTILPSVIDTPANRAAQPNADYSSWVAPARIARVIRFLVEDGSDAVSGAHIPVYGSA